MQINQMLSEDFRMRRELLLTRLDVTVQSFKWADRLKRNNNEISALYQQRRKELSIKPNVKLFHILAARDGNDPYKLDRYKLKIFHKKTYTVEPSYNELQVTEASRLV